MKKMAARLIPIDRETPLLLPPNLHECVRDDHLAHFILDAVAALDLHQVKTNDLVPGAEHYPPELLLALLIYSYATGNFSSRRIEQSTYDSVPVRLLTADTHPDHSTICAFRRANQSLVIESFVKVLQLAQVLKVIQVGQITLPVDDSEILQNSTKHSAVNYERTGQMIFYPEQEVRQLVDKAEQSDCKLFLDGLTIPEKIIRKQERQALLAKARAEIEIRARFAAERAQFEQVVAEREVRHERVQKSCGRPAKTSQPRLGVKNSYDLINLRNRIRKEAQDDHLKGNNSAPAPVEVPGRLVAAQLARQFGNDWQPLGAGFAGRPKSTRTQYSRTTILVTIALYGMTCWAIVHVCK